LQTDNPSTLDPRSAFNTPSNVLSPPSLRDESECQNDIRGEAAVECYDLELHDASTDSSRDRIRSVSDNSQNVADESVLYEISFVSSSPLLDDEYQIIPPTSSSMGLTTSPPMTATASVASINMSSVSPPQSFATALEQPPPPTTVISPITISNNSFMCPMCLRIFRTFAKAA